MTYYTRLNEIFKICIDQEISPEEIVENYSVPQLIDLIENKMQDLNESEVNFVEPYLTLGLFKDSNTKRRITRFVVYFDLFKIKEKYFIEKECEKYNDSQIIFNKVPKLKEYLYKNELIDFSIFDQIQSSEILKYSDSYFRISSYLNPSIILSTKPYIKDSKLYVRIYPHEIFCSEPMHRLLEEIIRPADPNWWKKLDIKKGCNTGAQYILQEPVLGHADYLKMWDYYARRIRKLEVYYARNYSGNLHGIIEEIDISDVSYGYIIGRCIHFDTDSPPGTPFDNSKMNHLDMAINVYFNGNIKKRMDDNLSKGKVVDASIRTHLMRVENISTKILLDYAIQFFKSKYLVSEWIKDQFNIENV